MASPYLKEHFLFKDSSVIKQDKEYRQFIAKLCSWTMTGRNKHDDVPDAMAMLVNFIEGMTLGQAQVFQRPF